LRCKLNSSPNSDPLVYISVLNWNSYEKTIHCIGELERLDYSNIRIIVVDNASRDGSVEHIRGAFPHLATIASKENLGYAGGHRLAVDEAAKAGADLIWLLNTDLKMRPDTLSALVDGYRRLGNALYGSIPLKIENTTRIGGFLAWVVDDDGKPDFNRELPFLGKPYDDHFGSDQSERPTAGLAGSSLLIPLAVIREHGFMDERFFLYSEEVDYCLRLLKKGVPAYIVPRSTVMHEYGGTYGKRQNLSLVVNYYYKRNRLILLRRHIGMGRYLQQLGMDGTKSLKKLLKYVLRHRNAPSALEVQCECWAVIDAAFNHMPKRFAPEDYLDQK
jgi:GT2 family glycosyltransferase